MRLSGRSLSLSAAVSMLVLLGAIVALVPVPYVTMRPGPTFDTLGTVGDTPMLTFGDGVKTYPTEGRLDFTTVSVTQAEAKMTLSTAFTAWLDPDVAVVPHSFLYPEGETDAQSREQGAAQLASSQDASKAAGLRAAGFTVPEVATVAQVVDGSPAEGKLRAGDEIVSVDGAKVTSQAKAAELIGGRKPGEEVTIGYRRGGQDGEVTVRTVAMDDDPDKARVGIAVGTSFDFPIEVENHIGDRVGGPSAGTMFALAIYDELTPGALTGGQHVAGTGTISPEGWVGSIGGVRQKMAGAARAGADIFLVPADNCEEAMSGGDFGMTIVKVGTLPDAITAVRALGEDPHADVPSCKAAK